jgi:hypothetical protein
MQRLHMIGVKMSLPIQDNGIVKTISVNKKLGVETRWPQVLVCCRNPSLGLATKARACEGASQKWSSGIIVHTPGSAGKCEGMNPHTPKWTPTLGVGILMDFWIFRRQFQGSKFIKLKSYLYHYKDLGT